MKAAAKLSLLVAALSMSASLSVRAQTTHTQLADVEKALDCLDRGTLSAWKREGIEPLAGSRDIVIFKYVSGGRTAIVKIMYYPSNAEANKSFKSFGEHASSTRKEIENLGDEAFSWSYEKSIVMRKGNLMVYVTAGSDISSLLPEIEAAETTALNRTESWLLTKNFARMMDKALSDLREPCRPDALYGR